MYANEIRLETWSIGFEFQRDNPPYMLHICDTALIIYALLVVATWGRASFS